MCISFKEFCVHKTHSVEINEAMNLIRFIPAEEPKQVWADLGCGSGVFTRALAGLLPKGSVIHAVDVDEKAIRKIPKQYNGVDIKTATTDFTSDEINLHQMDGILMANSLHYVKDREIFLKRILDAIKTNGYFLLVDYDINKANRWVPYPLPIEAGKNLFLKCSAKSFTVLNKRKSVFGDQLMYAALIKK